LRGETDRLVDHGPDEGAAVDLAARACRPVAPPDPSAAPLFGALARASAAVIVIVSDDGWSPMSDTFATTLGWETPPDLLELVHPHDRRTAQALWQTCRAGRTPAAPVDLRIQAADGSWYTMEVVARAVVDSTVAFYGNDVTVQRDTGRTVRLEQHRLASLVATMGDGLLLLDEADRICLANQAAYRLLDLVDTPVFDWDALLAALDLGPDKVTRLRDRGTHAVIGEEIDLVDGRVLEFDFVPVQPEDRRAGSLGTVVHLRDATKRVAARRGLEERSRGLEERNRALAEANALNNQFVASVSHELRGPLSSVVAFSHLLGDVTVGELSEDQRTYLAVIDRNANRLLRLIEDLLLLSRLESHTLQLKLVPSRLPDILAAAVAERTPAAETAKVFLALDCGTGPDVVCDDTRIHQVIDNLVSNAVKFTPAGGRVTVRGWAAGDAWQVEVADSGVGIPTADLPRLFSAFFRGSNVSSSGVGQAMPGGTGLGLVVCRAIVELHGGTINVASTEGVGTTVTLSLPTRPARTGG